MYRLKKIISLFNYIIHKSNDFINKIVRFLQILIFTQLRIVRVPGIMAYQFNFSILNFSQFHPHCARNPVLHVPT